MKNVIFKISKEEEDIGTIEVMEQGLRLQGDQKRLETVVSPLYSLSGIKKLRVENGKLVKDKDGRVVQDGALAITPENFDGICVIVRAYLKEALKNIVEVEE